MYARLFLLSGVLSLAACGTTATATDGGTGNGDGSGACIDNASQCDGNSFMSCAGGEWQVTEQCLTTTCDPNSGCVDCIPNLDFCEGEMIRACTDDGKIGTVKETCEGDDHCSGGSCRNLCLEAETALSYLGCEYWAVDLENAMQVEGELDFLGGCIFGD